MLTGWAVPVCDAPALRGTSGVRGAGGPTPLVDRNWTTRSTGGSPLPRSIRWGPPGRRHRAHPTRESTTLAYLDRGSARPRNLEGGGKRPPRRAARAGAPGRADGATPRSRRSDPEGGPQAAHGRVADAESLGQSSRTHPPRAEVGSEGRGTDDLLDTQLGYPPRSGRACGRTFDPLKASREEASPPPSRGQSPHPELATDFEVLLSGRGPENDSGPERSHVPG